MRDETYLEKIVTYCARLCQQGQYELCIRTLRTGFRSAPTDPRVYFYLAFAWQQMHQWKRAIQHYRDCLKLQPNFLEAHYNLAWIYQQQEHYSKAIHHYKHCLRIQPQHGEVCNNIAIVIRKRKRYEEAVMYHKRAVRWLPKNPRVYYNYGMTLFEMNRLDESISQFRKALEFYPHDPESKNALIRVWMQKGKMKLARAKSVRTIEEHPHHFAAYCHLAKAKCFTEMPPIVQTMETMRTNESLPALGKMYLAFALGKIYNDCGEYDQAFASWNEANQRKRAMISYHLQHDLHFMQEIIQAFSEKIIQKAQGTRDQLPILIVGMPRSGTTLVEQILASHPQVYGAGELTRLGRIIESLPRRFRTRKVYPACIHELSPDAFQALGETYIQHLRKHDPRAPYICDKMPHNFLHLGLIQCIMKNAKIIHCSRHPLDTCLSCFSTHFDDQGMNFTYELDGLITYYQQYQRLMEHWRETLPQRFFEIRYEDLILNPQETIRRLLEYCDLPWDAHCLHFHESSRPVKTASSVQVRQPLYTTSLHRWRNYEKYLRKYVPLFEE